MSRFLGVDVGGTKSAAVLIDGNGRTLAQHWAEHEDTSRTPLVEAILGSIDEVLKEAGEGRAAVESYGVAVAGLVSSDQSTVVHAATLGVVNVDLGAQLTSRLGRRVFVENDAAATLYGHSRQRARGGRPRTAADVSLLLTIGTGLGGAIMIGGNPLIGANGFAAELGHVTVDYHDTRLCLCRSRGCLENYCSGRGIAELVLGYPPPRTSRALAEIRDGQAVTSRHVVALAQLGDDWATALLTRSGAMLGRGLALLCTALDPTSVIIGGSFGHAAQRWLIPAARVEMARRWPFAIERPLPDIAVDTIGPYAAATGVALMALVATRPSDTTT
jgi:glucokinase